MTGLHLEAPNLTTSVRNRVRDLELHDPIVGISRSEASGLSNEETWFLVRLFGEPLGWHLVDVPPAGMSADLLSESVRRKWGGAVAGRLGLADTSCGEDPLAAARSAPGTTFSRAHEAYLSTATRCAVVVCTRDNPGGLTACLDSLAAQDHPDFTVWVVDNAPSDPATREVVRKLSGRLDVRYIVEKVPGLSRARNTALRQDLEADIVAWIDDDEVADQLWLAELSRGFAGRPEVVAASGAVVPAELATDAQLWFEQFGGHSKGRGFIDDEFSPLIREVQNPLYPLPPFGVGANMAFRVEVLRCIGGFDEALGAGTRTHASEDTRVFTEILRRGATSLYRPAALTRHYHRKDVAALKAQMYGYGCGLTAFYTALVIDHPGALLPLARLSARALREIRSDSSARHATLGPDFPTDLLAANRRGMAAGPLQYIIQREKNRRARRRHRHA